MIKELTVETTGGVSLFTTCFLPAESGAWPVIFTRCPYGAPGLEDPQYARMNAAGYAVVFQECRGTSRSGGQWIPFENEASDGLFTLNWISEQPFFGGEVYLYGGSYLAYVHLCMLGSLPPFVKGAMLSVFPADQYAASYLGGLFKHDLFTCWMLANPTTGLIPAPERLYDAITTRPQVDIAKRMFGVDIPWYTDVLRHPRRDEAWTAGKWGEFANQPSESTIPVVYVGAWHDIFIGAMLNTWSRLSAAAAAAVKSRWSMVVGPWTHGCAILPEFDPDFPLPNGEAIAFYNPVEFFDSIRNNAPYPVVKPGQIKRYVIGAGEWLEGPDLAANAAPARFYLNEDGISREKGAPAEKTYAYDPAQPAHFPGGENAFVNDGFGIMRQPEPNFRPDVLSFISKPLKETLRFEGEINVTLRVKSDCEDTAFIARICLIKSGVAFIIREYATTIRYALGDYAPGTCVDLRLEGAPVAWQINPGEQLRVDITSSNAPNLAIHANTATDWALEIHPKIAKNTVICGESFIELPKI